MFKVDGPMDQQKRIVKKVPVKRQIRTTTVRNRSLGPPMNNGFCTDFMGILRKKMGTILWTGKSSWYGEIYKGLAHCYANITWNIIMHFTWKRIMHITWYYLDLQAPKIANHFPTFPNSSISYQEKGRVIHRCPSFRLDDGIPGRLQVVLRHDTAREEVARFEMKVFIDIDLRRVPQMEVPKNDWLIRKSLWKWMIWGYPYFWKPLDCTGTNPKNGCKRWL